MFTNEGFNKLFHTPGISFNTIRQFRADRRLTEPFSIINDPTMQFGEYEQYPEPLAIVVHHNGF